MRRRNVESAYYVPAAEMRAWRRFSPDDGLGENLVVALLISRLGVGAPVNQTWSALYTKVIDPFTSATIELGRAGT